MKIRVRVHLNSKRQKVERISEKVLSVYTNKPAQKGQANKAVIKLLAKFLKIKKSGIILVRGKKSRNKVFEIWREEMFT